MYIRKMVFNIWTLSQEKHFYELRWGDSASKLLTATDLENELRINNILEKF